MPIYKPKTSLEVLTAIVDGATYGLAEFTAIVMLYVMALTVVNNIRDYRYRWAWIEFILTLILAGWMAFITYGKSSSVDTIIQSEYANNPEIKETLSYLSGIPYEVIILFLAFWLIVDLILRKKPDIARWLVPFKFVLTLMIIGNYAM